MKHEAPKIPIIEPTLRFIKSEGKKSKPITMETKTKILNESGKELGWVGFNICNLFEREIIHLAMDKFSDHQTAYKDAEIAELKAKLEEIKPVIEFALRIAKALKESSSSTALFFVQQAYPEDINGLEQQSSDEILENVITIASIERNT